LLLLGAKSYAEEKRRVKDFLELELRGPDT
jgi:hypothetical protein